MTTDILLHGIICVLFVPKMVLLGKQQSIYERMGKPEDAVQSHIGVLKSSGVS